MPPTRPNNRPFHLQSNQELMERAEDHGHMSDKNTCKPPQSQIAQALNRLDYAVDGAQEAFKTLDGRLGMILQPPLPEASDQANRTQPLVPLAADIERYAERINGLVYQMNQLTQRLGL